MVVWGGRCRAQVGEGEGGVWVGPGSLQGAHEATGPEGREGLAWENIEPNTGLQSDVGQPVERSHSVWLTSLLLVHRSMMMINNM